MTKFQRHARIVEIIENYDIETQEELTAKLCELGFNVTQATVSRDIKALHIIKAIGANGKYHYAMNSDKDENKNTAKFHDILSGIVISVKSANNIVVIKTYSGMAQAAATAIDAMIFKDIVGSLAGDDTIFIVVKDEAVALQTRDKFIDLLDLPY